MTDRKHVRTLAVSGPIAKKTARRSKGFETRDQRLPATPPLENVSAAGGPGIMAAVRARYRDALDLLFGAPPHVLNAACAISLSNHPASSNSLATHKERRQLKRKRQEPLVHTSSSEKEDEKASSDTDQVVPRNDADSVALRQSRMGCPSQDKCVCVNSLWANGSVGPELMLRTAEELSENIITLYRRAIDPESHDVDYSSLIHSHDFHKYLTSARKLRYFDPLLLRDDERKAFFLNVYNSLMIHAIAVKSKPRTMFERISLYNSAAYDIGGRPYSLNMIEHGVLRSNKRGSGPFAQPPFADTDARRQCILPTVDPRIHFALNCGAKSCPAVRFYDARNLDCELDSATRVYLQDLEVDSNTREVTLPKILQWYQCDFSETGDVDSLLRWTMPYLSASKKESLGTLLQDKEEGIDDFKVVFAGYDWTVNDSSV